MLVFFQIFSDVLREQDVSGIAAVHDSLCDIDAGTSDIGSFGYVDDPADGSTVDSHPKLAAPDAS